ncbi:MAG: tetratricopeptide (TPR) repeat protein [Saprospiraceae bacterium]|jgi:tetratricopeptide (TPR) repeat protein
MMNINIYWLIGLTIATLLGGVILAFTVNFWYALPLLIIGIILVVVYVLFGSVNAAAKHIQEGDFAIADKKLKLTWKPDWLYVTQRAFYYIMKGSIAMDAKDMVQAEAHFDHALQMELPSDNEKGMVLLQLANINATKGKWNIAKNYYRDIKKLKVTEKQIKEQIDQFGKALGNSGQVKAARSMGNQGMMQAGGKSKRRRPKMR